MQEMFSRNSVDFLFGVRLIRIISFWKAPDFTKPPFNISAFFYNFLFCFVLLFSAHTFLLFLLVFK